MAVRTDRSEVRTKTTEGQYSPVRLELARLVRSLLYGTRAMLVLNFPAFENKKYTAYDRFHGNGPYGKIPTKKEPIRTLGFALPYNNTNYRQNRKKLPTSDKKITEIYRQPTKVETFNRQPTCGAPHSDPLKTTRRNFHNFIKIICVLICT